MRKPAANIVRIGCLVMLLDGLTSPSAAGYTLVDWIRTWPTSAPGAVAAPAFPAVVPTYPAPAPGCAAPAPSCGAAAPSCESRPPYYSAPATTAPAPNCGAALPPAPVGAGVSYVQPTVGVAMPVQQVRYRSTWVRVPTTNYRPIVSYDPATGWPTTTLRPCTTYTWQVQRVPADRPGSWLLAPFRNLFGPAYPPPAPVVSTYVPAPVAAPGWTGAAVPAMPAAPAYAAPAYTAPPSLAPSSPYGGTAPLAPPTPSPGWVPSGAAPPSSAPAGSAPPIGTGVPAGSAPADVAPQLSPNEVPRLQPIPEIRNYAPANEGGSTPAPAPLLNPSPPPSSPPPSTVPPGVSPVPDPDADRSRSQVPAAPSLYDPNGRTARVLPLSTSWPAAPIRWPAPAAQVEAPAVTTSGLKSPSQTPATLDADGWQTVRP